jgi:Ca2+-binding EF-hand superfamily protein
MQHSLSQTNKETTMKTLNTLAAALVATFAVTANAGMPGGGDCPSQGAGPGKKGAAMLERLKAADKNADGMISREEAQASLPGIFAHFDAIDANKDGFITIEELKAARQAHRGAGGPGAMFGRLDVNGDGKLSRAEVANAPRLAEHFDAIDANKDGFLTPDEIRAARQANAGRGCPQ